MVSLWLYDLNTMVVARYVVPTQLGEPASPADGMRRALKRALSFTGAYVLSLFWGVGAMLLMMLPGGVLAGVGAVMGIQSSTPGTRIAGIVLAGGGAILAMFGLLGGGLWYLLRFCLLAPVMALEDLPAMRSFRRSGELLSGRVEPGFIGRMSVRAMILVTVASVILLAVSVLCGMPALILQFAYGVGFDPAAAAANPVPQSLLVPAELLQVVDRPCSTRWGSSSTPRSTWTCACAARGWIWRSAWRRADDFRAGAAVARGHSPALRDPGARAPATHGAGRAGAGGDDAHLEALESRWQGLPMRSPEDTEPDARGRRRPAASRRPVRGSKRPRARWSPCPDGPGRGSRTSSRGPSSPRRGNARETCSSG